MNFTGPLLVGFEDAHHRRGIGWPCNCRKCRAKDLAEWGERLVREEVTP